MWCSTVGVIVTLPLSLLAAPLVTDAQSVRHVSRIGRRSAGAPRPDRTPPADAFRQGLRDLGSVEGQNLVIESRGAEGRAERLPALAAAFVWLHVDVLVAVGPTATRAAQHATRTLPVVMTGTADPVGAGCVASLAQPGGTITGVRLLMVERPGKRRALRTETVSQRTRVAVLATPALAGSSRSLPNLTVAARALGRHRHVVEVRSADELAPACAAMTREGADALMVLSDPALMERRLGRVVDLAATHRLPARYNWTMSVEAGGLMSYGPSRPERHRRAATYVDKIRTGAKPADLPVERPTTCELVINLKAAKALGLTMPPALLLQANKVIQ